MLKDATGHIRLGKSHYYNRILLQTILSDRIKSEKERYCKSRYYARNQVVYEGNLFFYPKLICGLDSLRSAKWYESYQLLMPLIHRKAKHTQNVLPLLKSQDWKKQFTGAWLISEHSHLREEWVQPLLDLVHHRKWKVRLSAVRAITRLYSTRRAHEIAEKMVDYLQQMKAPPEKLKKAVQVWQDTSKKKVPLTKQQLLLKKAVPALLKIVEDVNEHCNVRQTTLLSLRSMKIKAEKMFPRLQSSFQSRCPCVRYMALFGMGLFADRKVHQALLLETLPTLRKGLQDTDPWVQREAMWTINWYYGTIGLKTQVNDIPPPSQDAPFNSMTFIQNRKPRNALEKKLLNAIKKSIPLISKMLRHPWPDLQNTAIDLLIYLDPPKAPTQELLGLLYETKVLDTKQLIFEHIRKERILINKKVIDLLIKIIKNPKEHGFSILESTKLLLQFYTVNRRLGFRQSFFPPLKTLRQILQKNTKSRNPQVRKASHKGLKALQKYDSSKATNKQPTSQPKSRKPKAQR